MIFNDTSSSDLCVKREKPDLTENHLQVTPSFKSLKNMSAQVRVAFKVSEGGLRNALLHPGSCVTLVC